MADILIRDMEMPKTCVQCDLKRYDQERIWTDNGVELLGAWVCKRTDEIIWNTQRGENCPIFALPEKYGRLIDADALIEAYTPDSYELNKMHMTRESYDKIPTVAVIKKAVSNAPTIVPAEEGSKDDN